MALYYDKYVRFDWAMKRLLRNKTNHAVLEGLLLSLIGKKIVIKHFLESEGNQEDLLDKYNRVDILAEDEDGELIIIEIQNSHEITYFHRMLYGVSKAITEYIDKGDSYDKVRKIYSINIVYFELGQGKDYVYHGKTEFKGLHAPHDLLKLSAKQSEKFLGISESKLEKRKDAGELFPEYYILRVNDFDKIATTPLDEWIEFLKTGKIDDNTKAAGLAEARKQLRVDSLPDNERRAYERYMESVRHMRSLFDTSHDDGYTEGHAEGRAAGLVEGRAVGLVEGRAAGLVEGRAERSLEIARQLKAMGMSKEQIMQATGLQESDIQHL
ncbi:MAG: Rpn family recombination-promoting nuclease/putative transposase [Prevotella sp.]|nr:Rpn family recombination-promoting nuclease/putative transposase [Prevotella sp.]